MVKEERRRFPRIIDKDFTVELKMGEFDVLIHTLNISASGVYCKIDREIPIMSRVKLVMMIPEHTKDGEVKHDLNITGVVVREHPVIINGETKHYDLAIFFEDISADDRAIISSYISRKNSQSAQ